MTSFEHAMLGINGALAAGLHRRHGWKIVALAGFAATSPDWDALTIVWGVTAFAEGHRVWGHNLLVCVVSGVLLGLFDYRFDLVTRGARLLARVFPLIITADLVAIRRVHEWQTLCLWTLVATIAVLSHLPADLVVSGTATLSDWELKLLWPFSNQGWVFPLVHWGDVGITLIFAAGMLVLARWRCWLRVTAGGTLLLVLIYLLVRGQVWA